MAVQSRMSSVRVAAAPSSTGAFAPHASLIQMES
jgi:hypothetical protein